MSRTAGPRKDERNGTWWFVVDVGVGPDGKRRQAKRRGFATKRTAQEEFDRLKVSVHDSSYVAPKRQRLGEFLEEWLKVIEQSVAPSTFASYRRNLRVHVMPRIGGVQLQVLDAAHLNRLYAELLASGRADQRAGGLAPRTVAYIHTILRRALKDAVRSGRLVRNPADVASQPGRRRQKEARGEMQTWSGAEVEQFLAAEAGTRYGPAFLFLATTGCRRGEALGLRWSDVDLEDGSAEIRQTVTAIDHAVHIAPATKGGDGRRVELDAKTVSVLRSHRAVQLQERLLVGSGYVDQGLVFALPDGRPYHPERFSREFDRRVARHGLPRIRTHDLRHTWATLALQSGLDAKIVSERLGHASPVVTLTVYRHVTRPMASDAAERVAAIIFGGSK